MPRFTNRLTVKRKGVGRKKKTNSEVGTSSGTSTSKPSTSKGAAPRKPSSSSKKIEASRYAEFENYNGNNYNEIINMDLLSTHFSALSLCKKCKANGLQIRSVSHIGLAAMLEIFCDHCGASEIFYSSKEVEIPGSNRKPYEVNVRIVYGLRSIGKGMTAGQTLCGVLNLPNPPTKFIAYTNLLREKAELVAVRSMKAAVEEAVSNENLGTELLQRDISAAFDGTWQRRGFKSLNGVVTCTSIESGKVMDVICLSKYCLCLDKTNHEQGCKANYQGSSGGMEGAGANQIFRRSIDKYNVRYVRYLGDGDTNSFASVVENDPYGEGCKVEKLECVNHVCKRMGARLRKLRQEKKKVKLADGRGLSGKNRLTDKVVDKLQSYYGRAIKDNSSNAELMRKAIWAIYFHYLSSDKTPNHGLCPKGETSWCKYNKAVATNTLATFKHKSTLPEAIMNEMRPTFKALSEPSLLRKCLHGKTQNVNESLNNVIWTRVPKNNFVTLRTLELGTYEAVSCFNDGMVTKCRILKEMGIEPGLRTVDAMHRIDIERVRMAEKAISDYDRAARQQSKLRKRKLEHQYEDNNDYEAGMH